ncbi:hypothetical protein ACWIGI_17925 [Nocardia sp. NPDC055321]
MTSVQQSNTADQSEFSTARAAEKAALTKQNALASRTVASHAHDAEDCRYLLEMLGLDGSAPEE